MSKHILVCLPISAEQRTRIEAVQGFAYRFTTPDTATVEDALWADAVLGNLPVPLIRQNGHLEWFQSNAAGPNNYLEPGVLPEKCIVTNATGAYGLAISECMLAMWLSLLKELPTYRDNQREHRWAPTGHFVGSIAGSRVLCVGMGDIGSNFARRAYALGAEVVGVRRTVHPDTPCPDYCTRVVAQSALDAELPQADLVALSLPGTPETLHLFGAERLALCKPGAILLNVGRGTAVDGEALAAAVHSGQLSGAGLDVTDPEPLPPEHPLWAEPNVIITPHVTGGGAGLCQLGSQRLGSFAAQVRGLGRGVHLYGGHLAAGHGDCDGHLAQATLCRGGVAAIGQRCGVVGGGYGAGVVDIQVQHNAHQHGGHQHEQDITGHFCGHGMVSSP